MQKSSQYKSERLLFRGIEKADAEMIVAWRSIEENYRNFFNARAISLDEHLAWFDRYLNDETRFDFMVIDSDGKAIGTVGLSDIDSNSCEVSYMIGDEASRGKGYAKEAVRTMTQVAFSDLGVERVFARIKPSNAASINVVEGIGFSPVEMVYSFEMAPGDDTK